jgi:hypothetical protein
VTLFASGDSSTRAELVAVRPDALRLNRCADPIAPHVAMMERCSRAPSDFDVMHFHTDYLHTAWRGGRRSARHDDARAAGHSPELEPLFARSRTCR